MYEHMTFEIILDRMLSKIPDTFDKREGSIIYNALAPSAVEMQNMYIELDTFLDETFADTATRDYLIKRTKERGINPYAASYAILKGEFNIDVPLKSRFSLEDLNYEVIERLDIGIFKLQCEIIGEVGNNHLGTLIPIEYIEGLTKAELTEVLIYGEDEEDTENLRNRYFDSFDVQSYGGNIKDYKDKTNAIAGVGATKVTPVWQGGGTVLLTILDTNYNKATDTLIDTVQEIIDPIEHSGEGLGVAGIDHKVTVNTADELKIDISIKVTLDGGYDFDSLKDKFLETLNDYFAEIRKEWAEQKQSIIRVSQIETRLLAISEVIDIEGTKINSTEGNLTLGEYEIPSLGDIRNE